MGKLSRRRALVLSLSLATLGLGGAGLAGCSSGDGDGGGGTLQGAVLEPAPDVSALSLPNALTGEPVSMTAPDGEVRLVYFGYTYCPDVCPTTLAHVKLALNRMDADDAAKVSLVMATVDPERDTGANLQAYMESFTKRSTALRTADDSVLKPVADAFGVSYSVTKTAGGDVEVAHTGTLYAVDDTGHLVDQWPFDADATAADAIANDLEILVDRA